MVRRIFRVSSIFSFVIVATLIAIKCYATEPFSISEGNFIPKYKEECVTDIKIWMEGGKYIFDGIHSVKGGNCCHKARHTLIGKVIIFDYVFGSDKDDPLQFVVDKDKGYVFLKGRGNVTKPDGEIIKLPLRK